MWSAYGHSNSMSTLPHPTLGSIDRKAIVRNLIPRTVTAFSLGKMKKPREWMSDVLTFCEPLAFCLIISRQNFQLELKSDAEVEVNCVTGN